MEIAEYIRKDGVALAEKYLRGEIQLPVQIVGAMWLALPGDSSVLAHGAVKVSQGDGVSREFKIGVVKEITPSIDHGNLAVERCESIA